MKRKDFISLTHDCKQNLGIAPPLPFNTGVCTSNEGPGVPDFDQPIHPYPSQPSPTHPKSTLPQVPSKI